MGKWKEGLLPGLALPRRDRRICVLLKPWACIRQRLTLDESGLLETSSLPTIQHCELFFNSPCKFLAQMLLELGNILIYNYK
ncbi:hypothetical protein I79_019788 [Cricetulus griseus]|uniref:Uncharacterized protein n=1 Tax=Cricetulus griseus TaxID=10029 RepID=G3I8C4_CRIGR|nr:hypothetical protein I79_019788 [Cricetulus griseus]